MLTPMEHMPSPQGAGLQPTNAAPYIWLAALMSLALFAIDTWWPQFGWLARPFIWLGTLFHELGHGIAAILVGGELVQLAIFPDGSGLAVYHGVSSTFDRALVAAAGPLGAPIAGLLLFFSLGHRQAARLALAMLGAGLAVAVLLWVRNAFALGFVAALVLWLAWVAWRGSEHAVYLLSAFMAVEMSLSAFTRMDYLFSAGAVTAAGPLPSDTAQIAQALGFSHVFWGAMLALVALGVVALGAWRAIRLGRLQQ